MHCKQYTLKKATNNNKNLLLVNNIITVVSAACINYWNMKNRGKVRQLHQKSLVKNKYGIQKGYRHIDFANDIETHIGVYRYIDCYPYMQ